MNTTHILNLPRAKNNMGFPPIPPKAHQKAMVEEHLPHVMGIISKVDKCMLDSDFSGVKKSIDEWYSVVENLHDYSVGLMAPEGIGTAFINESSAKPGQIPLWGQKGEFVICVQGIRSLVKFGGIRWHGVFHFSFEAIELSMPFISKTGYRSQFVTSPNTLFGLNVQEAAEIIFNEWLNKGSSIIEQTESLKERTAEINDKPYVKDMVMNVLPTGHCYQLSMF